VLGEVRGILLDEVNALRRERYVLGEA